MGRRIRTLGGREGGRVTTRKRWLVLPTESWALQLCSHVVVCKFIQSTLSVFDGNSILFRGVRAVRGGGDELIKRWEVSVPRWWFFISRPLSLSYDINERLQPRCQDGRRSSPSPFHPPSLSTSFSHTQSLFLIRYSSQVLPTSSEFTSPSTPLSKEFLFCACLCLHISLFRYGKGKFLFFCWEGAYISRLRLIWF